MLENSNLRLRAMEPTDLDRLYKWENDNSVWEHGVTHNPLSRYTLKSYIENSHSDVYEDKGLRLMIEQKDNLESIGCIDLYDFDFHNQKAGIAILIAPESRGCGRAHESVNLLVEYAFSFLKLKQLYAYVSKKNSASIALFSKCGFEQTAILKQWIKTPDGYADVHVFQLFNK